MKALESFSDINLIEAIVMCLTRLQPLLRPESPIHKALFWVAISILQVILLYVLTKYFTRSPDPDWGALKYISVGDLNIQDE